METAASSRDTRHHRPNVPGFWALFCVQAQGAFSDNLFRWTIVYALLRTAGESGSSKSTIISLGAIVFSLAYLVCPGTAGALADRFSKRHVIIATKALEIAVMTMGLLAFQAGNAWALWCAWFLMSLQSAMFGPAKYGILPEIFPETRLSWANGVMQLGLFSAIIGGTILGGVFADTGGSDQPWIAPETVSKLLIGISCAGFVLSWLVPKVPAALPSKPIPFNPWNGVATHISDFRHHPVLMLTLVGGTYFWFIGALVQQNIVLYNDMILKGSDTLTSVFQAVLMVGIGLGSFSAGYLSRRKIELGLMPVGLVGMAVTSLLLAASWDMYALFILVALFAFFGGFYEVPVDAALQHRTPPSKRGGMIAVWGIVTCVGILASGALFMVAGMVGLGPRQVFLLTAIFPLLMLIYIAVAHPLYMLRAGLWMMTSTLYRVKAIGRRNLPERGPALLVANHSSFFDALCLLAAMDREVRFVISQEIYEVPWIRPLARVIGAIPISAVGGPSKLAQSFHRATEELKNGGVVCIFAEGQVTRTGHILPFRKSLERIGKGVDAPIIPVHIDRLWGTVINYTGSRFQWKLPARIPYPLIVNFGAPMAPDTPSWAVRTAVQELGTDAYERLKRHDVLLHRIFIREARRHPFRLCCADERSGELKYALVLIGAIALARKLKPILGDEPMVGLLVPPSVGGAVVNIALQFMGKTPVNLNYTSSNESIASCARQCDIKHTLTAKAFLQKLPNLAVPGEPVFLDDIKGQITKKDRIVAALIAFLTPKATLERLCGTTKPRSADDLAAIIFSSGSSGEPKGIMLTHRNIAANIDSSMQVFPHRNDDCVMGILPFFHSFGFTGTLWLPLARGFTVVYHPNPLESKNIGELVHKYKARFLFATPTFLLGYIRRVLPEQFESLVYVITGAEKLPERVRHAFKNKFNVEPLEGYGCTECAPIVSVNIPDFKAPGYYRVGTKHGTIGHPLPGISIRIADPDTNATLTNGSAGLLQVKGPNVMTGYLNLPDKTQEVLREGWYDTGDVARIDDDGFITITDRLSRFSKIGGEMVPHARVEEVLHAVLSLTEQRLAVAGVPDESKGERLVVLHTLNDDALEDLLGQLDQSGLPNLWRPRPSAFYRIEEIPVLGSGKMDLQAIKKMARSLDVGE